MAGWITPRTSISVIPGSNPDHGSSAAPGQGALSSLPSLSEETLNRIVLCI